MVHSFRLDHGEVNRVRRSAVTHSDGSRGGVAGTGQCGLSPIRWIDAARRGGPTHESHGVRGQNAMLGEIGEGNTTCSPTPRVSLAWLVGMGRNGFG